MLYRISILLDEKYKLGQDVKNAELIALQEQINPHFLYNSLDQIYWMSIRKGCPEIGDLVLKLSKFYRQSLRKGKNIVPFSTELEHISAYTDIQNIRYDGAITLQVNCSEKAAAFELPKLTLQPLVENAILHGICEKDEKGTISINAEITSEHFVFTVQDDGAGMDEETLLSLREGITTSAALPAAPVTSKGGYGLRNVYHRLQLAFHNRVMFEINSPPGQGTEITVRIPLIDAVPEGSEN
jgi:two-component system sensor histidine kinase YesM